MEKKRRKRGENSYLNDFHPNLAGEYIYSGELYACALDETAQRGMRRSLAAAILAFLGILCECMHLALAGHGGRLFYAVLYLIFKVLSILCALTIRRAMLRTNWSKVPKCDEQ